MPELDLSYIAEELRPLARPMSEILKDSANLRLHPAKSIEGIKASIGQFKQRKNVVLQRRADGSLVCRAGNGTIEAAQALGWSHIAAVIVEETDTEAVRFAIADNRTAELSHWDLPALSMQLEALSYEVPGLDDQWVKEVQRYSEAVPAFQPTSAAEQGDLDKVKQRLCPHCGMDINEPSEG